MQRLDLDQLALPLDRGGHDKEFASKYGASVELLYMGSVDDRDERIDAMPEEWSKLCSTAGSATRFNDQTSMVRRIVFTAKSEDPSVACTYVIVARQGGSLAVLISDIDRSAVSGRLGKLSKVTPTITRLEVPETGILVRHRPELCDLSSQIVQSCLTRGVADHLCIRNLSVDHPAFETLRQWFSLGPYGSGVAKMRWSASLLDPDTGERVDKHSRKTRGNLRRSDRRLVQAFDGEAELECIALPAQVEDFVRAASGIIGRTYQAALGIGVQDTEEYRSYLREMVEAGNLHGYVLRGKGAPPAYAVGDRWGADPLLYAKRALLAPSSAASRMYLAAKSQCQEKLARSGFRNRIRRIWRKRLVASHSANEGSSGP